MPSSLTRQLSRKNAYPFVFSALAAVAILASVLSVVYERALAAISSRGVASLETPAACAVSAPQPTVNTHKQLFVSCAGFLD
jgi:hypothetical protein